jgi:hypothetical protein
LANPEARRIGAYYREFARHPALLPAPLNEADGSIELPPLKPFTGSTYAADRSREGNRGTREATCR